MDVMPEIMPDDTDLFHVVQRLVVVLPLFADHLAGKGQLFLSLFASRDVCGAVSGPHIEQQQADTENEKEKKETPALTGWNDHQEDSLAVLEG